MAINNEPTIKPRTITGIFTGYIAKVLPLAFDDSMSYYECLCALLKYLNETIVTDINNTNDGLSELQTFYTQLQDYVNHYFENLDVQNEINKKLDEMAEDGTLTNLIKNYVDPLYQAYETEINEEISSFKNSVNGQLATIDNKVNTATSGSPKGVYATVSALTTADPDHDYVYLVTADGKWYYYDTSSSTWTAGGTYQASSVSEDDPVIVNIDDTINYFHSINDVEVDYSLQNKYLNYNSRYGDYNDFNISDVIVMKKGDVLEVETYLLNGMCPIKSVYFPTNYNTISGLENLAVSGTAKRTYTAIRDIEYVYYTYSTTHTTTVKLYKVNEEYSYNYDDLLSDYVSGYYHKNNLSFNVGGGIRTVKNIHLYKNDILHYQCSAGTYSVVSILTLMDNNDTPIKVLQLASDNDVHEYTYQATEECYVSLSYSEIYRAYAYIQTYNEIEELNTIVYNLSDDVYELKIPKYVTLFNKVFCLGDSITEGYRAANKPIDKLRSYPSYLAKIYNTDVINGGISGATPKSWYESRIATSTYDFSDYDICIINLGQNGGLTDTLDRDVDPYDNPEDYANTQTGWYCRIIESIKSQNANLVIFLCQGQKDSTTNLVIQKIATKYSLPTFDYTEIDPELLESYLHTSRTNESYTVHFNSLGYFKLAKAIGYGIDYYVSNHLTEFKEVKQ